MLILSGSAGNLRLSVIKVEQHIYDNSSSLNIFMHNVSTSFNDLSFLDWFYDVTINFIFSSLLRMILLKSSNESFS